MKASKRKNFVVLPPITWDISSCSSVQTHHFCGFTSNKNGHNASAVGVQTKKAEELPPITWDITAPNRTAGAIFPPVLVEHRRCVFCPLPPTAADKGGMCRSRSLQYTDTYPPIFRYIPPMKTDTTSNNSGQNMQKKTVIFLVNSAFFLYLRKVCKYMYVFVREK